jgi:hypothetical protein
MTLATHKIGASLIQNTTTSRSIVLIHLLVYISQLKMCLVLEGALAGLNYHLEMYGFRLELILTLKSKLRLYTLKFIIQLTFT